AGVVPRVLDARRGRCAGRRRAGGPRVLRGGLVQLEQMYQEIILDHYRSPHRAGLREPFDAESFQINPTCGDEITLRVKLDGSTGTATVADVSYETLGCSISQASASVLTDLVVGRSVGDSLKVLAAF